MTNAELIERLSRLPGDQRVMISASLCPRDINSGPRSYTITETDAEDSADCEGLEGQTVTILGFGSY